MLSVAAGPSFRFDEVTHQLSIIHPLAPISCLLVQIPLHSRHDRHLRCFNQMHHNRRHWRRARVQCDIWPGHIAARRRPTCVHRSIPAMCFALCSSADCSCAAPVIFNNTLHFPGSPMVHVLQSNTTLGDVVSFSGNYFGTECGCLEFAASV